MGYFRRLALSALMVVAGAVSAFAYDFEVDGIFYNTISFEDLTCEITYEKIEDGYYSPYSGNFVIPTSVTYAGRVFDVVKIGDSAFCNCKYLTSVVIPNSVTAIGKDVFWNCESLSSVVIPESVASIGSYAFSYCRDLTTVEIPNSVVEIGYDTFRGCISLTSVVIPNSVTWIGDGAFRSCISLTSIVIPNSVTWIGQNVFMNCTSLEEITSLNTTPPSIERDDTFEGVSKTECVVKVPEEAVDAYKAAEHWKAFWNIVSLNGGGDTPEKEMCEAPEIALVDGSIVATSATEGAKCYTTITSDDFKSSYGSEPISLSGVYRITSYATAEGYEKSETVTALLVWMNPVLKEDASDVMQMGAQKAVVIKAAGDGVKVLGTEAGETVRVYSLDGVLMGSARAVGGETLVPCAIGKGEAVVVRYGDRAVKMVY